MNARILSYIGIIVLLLIYGTGAGVAGYSYAQKGKSQAIIDQLEDDKKAVAEVREVIKWRTKKVVKYVDKIKTVADKTGCADIVVDPAIDDELFNAYSLAKGPEASGAVRIRELSIPGNAEDVGGSTGESVGAGG